MKVLILRGLPGSGKTTWAKEFCEKNIDWVRVNRDDLRRMRLL
jgi:adenylate kinase family enzyme